MDISLTFRDLKKLALDGKVTKEGVTIVVKRPVISSLSLHPHEPIGSVTFRLDATDPEALQTASEPM